MKIVKIAILGSICVSVLSIAGCHSGGNKLLSAPKKQTAEFLFKAQNYASENTHIYDSVGSAYIRCLQNPAHFNNPFLHGSVNRCDVFFKEMGAFAKNSKQYQSVTVEDLKDKKLIKRFSAELQTLQMQYQR